MHVKLPVHLVHWISVLAVVILHGRLTGCVEHLPPELSFTFSAAMPFSQTAKEHWSYSYSYLGVQSCFIAGAESRRYVAIRLL
jgi:hypothetical protein